MPNRDEILEKLAEAQKSEFRQRVRKIKRFIRGLGSGRVTGKQLKVIKKQVKQVQAKSDKDRQIERLSGRKWTKNQYIRGAGIGAGVGAAAHILGTAIGGAGPAVGGVKPSLVKAMANPRSLVRGAAITALYGSALPAARRLADIEAAKRGKY